MFYYYGAKKQLAPHYPKPLHRLVVEPFAGSGAYSMYQLLHGHADRAILIEKDPRVAELWHRLLGMSVEDVQAIRIPSVGERVTDFLYMTTATGNAIAHCKGMTVTPRMPRIIEIMLTQIAKILPVVKNRVEVIHGDCFDQPNRLASWFIDPPYMAVLNEAIPFSKGFGYAKGCDTAATDYTKLAEFCQTRLGHVVVVEQLGATWLPFQKFSQHPNALGRHGTEMLWEKTS